MTPEEQLNNVPFHKTQADLIRNIIESYVFIDFARIVEVKSDNIVSVEVGLYNEDLSRLKLSEVELLSIGGGQAGVIYIEPNLNDIVMVFALRSYVKTLTKPIYDKHNTLKYALGNIKAVMFMPDGGTSKNKIRISKNGEINISSEKFILNNGGDAVVLYNNLNTLLSTFITTLNAALVTAAGGYPPAPLTLDITTAKSKTLEVDS